MDLRLDMDKDFFERLCYLQVRGPLSKQIDALSLSMLRLADRISS
jgi:hypothetical protein